MTLSSSQSTGMASAPQVGALSMLLTERASSDSEHNMVSQLHICMFASMQSSSRAVESLEICCLSAHGCCQLCLQSPSRAVSLKVCCLRAVFSSWLSALFAVPKQGSRVTESLLLEIDFQLMVVDRSVCAGRNASLLCIHSLLHRQSAPSLLRFHIRAVVLSLHYAMTTAKQDVCKPDADGPACRCPFAASPPA